MLKFLRLLILIFTPLLFLGAWYIVPEILESTTLNWLAGGVSLLWGLEFFILQRLSVVSAVDGLSSREHERLILRLQKLRRRIWWIGGIGFVSAISIWILTALKLPVSSPLYATLAGVLFGICLSYIILIPGWFNEMQHFIDDVKKRSDLMKKAESISKQLSQ